MEENIPDVGRNLRKLRQDMGISLDKASSMTGVSKAMLGQIERGESSPTISTLWKISTGFKISFTSLLGENSEECEVVKKEDIEPIIEEDGDMRLYSLFPFEPQSRFELFLIELYPNCEHISATHDNVQEEYVLVIDGSVEMRINGKDYKLEKGHSIKFDGTYSHTYKNMGSKKAVFYNIELYR